MSDTPETDALIESCDQHKPHTNFGEALKLARSLERRLRQCDIERVKWKEWTEEAQRNLQLVRDAANELRTELMIAVRGRDAALREVEELRRAALEEAAKI